MFLGQKGEVFGCFGHNNGPIASVKGGKRIVNGANRSGFVHYWEQRRKKRDATGMVLRSCGHGVATLGMALALRSGIRKDAGNHGSGAQKKDAANIYTYN